MIDIKELALLCEREGVQYRREEPLAPHTTFQIGGPAALFCEPESIRATARLLSEASRPGIPFFVLGRGSNVLFADEGYRGMVLHIGKGMDPIRLADETTIVCGSGAKLSSLCEFARDHGLSGLEFAFGIPGTVGGAITMNAGAYGGEMRDVLIRADHIEPDGAEGFFERGALALSYRRSVYSSGGRIITGGTFRLQKENPEAIADKMRDYLTRRREKQPLELPSAGSTFKRPANGYASALIDRCGLKGLRVGGAAVSEKHAGFVVNTGGATARDVVALMEQVQAEVLRQTGTRLEPEVMVVGPA